MPGADDAAYRLGRVEELSGRFADAVVTMDRAVQLPDGDMSYWAATREAYILDDEMTPAQLEAMAHNPRVDALLRQRAAYSWAVDLMRLGQYRKAALLLRAVQQTEQGRALSPLDEPTGAFSGWPFAAALTIQASQAEALAQLEAAVETARTSTAKAAAQYNEAAYIYHRTLLFYNYLWGGTRSASYPYDTSADLGGPQTFAYVAGMNNYLQAARQFEAMAKEAGGPAPIREKALFSYGMSLYHLNAYGPDVDGIFSPSDLAQTTAQVFAAFVRQYPQDPLAPEALTLEAAFTGRRQLLEELVTTYSATAQGEDAKADLEQRPWPANPIQTVGMPLLDQEILVGTPGVPGSVLGWAKGPGPQVATKVIGNVTYVRIKPAHVRPGEYPSVTSVTDAGPRTLSLGWGTGPLAIGVARPVPLYHAFALIRLSGDYRIVHAVRAPSPVPAQ